MALSHSTNKEPLTSTETATVGAGLISYAGIIAASAVLGFTMMHGTSNSNSLSPENNRVDLNQPNVIESARAHNISLSDKVVVRVNEDMSARSFVNKLGAAPANKHLLITEITNQIDAPQKNELVTFEAGQVDTTLFHPMTVKEAQTLASETHSELIMSTGGTPVPYVEINSYTQQ